MSIVERLILKTLRSFDVGKKTDQEFWEQVHKMSLLGLNFGNGGDLNESGELEALMYIKSKVPSSATIFDVGANRGQYSSQLVKIFPKAQIHAFEPAQKVYAQMEEAVKHFPLITPHNLGLSDTTGKLSLFSSPVTSEISSVYQRRLDHINVHMNDVESISLETLDNFCEQHHIDFIDFLKLDVEGHELKVLQGAKNMLRLNKIKFIQFEFGGTNIDSRTYLQDFYYLLKEKFDFYRIVRDGLYPIINYKETDEIFTTINYLAVQK